MKASIVKKATEYLTGWQYCLVVLINSNLAILKEIPINY